MGKGPRPEKMAVGVSGWLMAPSCDGGSRPMGFNDRFVPASLSSRKSLDSRICMCDFLEGDTGATLGELYHRLSIVARWITHCVIERARESNPLIGTARVNTARSRILLNPFLRSTLLLCCEGIVARPAQPLAWRPPLVRAPERLASHDCLLALGLLTFVFDLGASTSCDMYASASRTSSCAPAGNSICSSSKASQRPSTCLTEPDA